MILLDVEDCQEGVMVKGKKINNLRYIDDTVLIATLQKGLQNLFDITLHRKRVCNLFDIKSSSRYEL